VNARLRTAMELALTVVVMALISGVAIGLDRLLGVL
jgi:elongation factor P--beta-lysine ligase